MNQKISRKFKLIKAIALSAIAATIFSVSSTLQAKDDVIKSGIVTVMSEMSFEETVSKLETTLKNKGMTLFTIVDHAKGAAPVDLELEPTTLFIFGNPKAGTPLMLCNKTAALDLPQKMLITESEEGVVSISYNDPEYLAQRHDLIGCEKNVEKISSALSGIAKSAASQ